MTYLFAALDLTEGEMQPDEDEFVEVVRLPIAEVEKMIERDEIRDAKTVAAMYRAKLKNLYYDKSGDWRVQRRKGFG